MTTDRFPKKRWLGAVAVVVVAGLSALAGCSGDRPSLAETSSLEKTDQRTVLVVTPRVVELSRTTTQPATVHAFYEAKIFAKAAGYLSQLNVDIGQPVTQGEVLAIIDVPEMVKQREAKLAAIRRLEADERRTNANSDVAQASVASYQAKLEQAKAGLGQAHALLTASRVEMERVRDLVGQKAVADRLLDEAQMKYEAAEAEKVAAQAAIASAEAELELSRATAEAAKADVEVAQALTDVARHELEELDERLQFATLRSPFDGVVVDRNVAPGDLVRNAQAGSGGEAAMFVVAQVETIRIRVPVPERDAPLVSVGDEARITLQALPGKVFEGKVSRFARGLDESTRTMTVEIDLPNPDSSLLPGMFGQATILLEEVKNRIVLPAGAVRYDAEGRSSVYVLDKNDEVQVQEVTPGLDDGGQIEIVAGLTGSERVVGPTLHRLAQGEKVRVE